MQNDRDLVQQSIYTSLKTFNISNYKHMKHALETKGMSLTMMAVAVATMMMMMMTKNKWHYSREHKALMLHRLHQ
jgi:hypothetical protein